MKPSIVFAALGLAIGTVAPANAAALMGADRIVISNAASSTDPNLEWLQVGELLALQAGIGTDVALASNGGQAAATSFYGPDNNADKAIDGLFPSGYIGGGYPGPNGIYHSQGNDGTDTLTVTFSATDLGAIEIYGRTDCCQARDIYNVTAYAGTTVLYSGKLDASTAGYAVASFAPIPEPTTWAFLFLGFGAIGWTLRGARRNQTAVAAA